MGSNSVRSICSSHESWTRIGDGRASRAEPCRAVPCHAVPYCRQPSHRGHRGTAPPATPVPTVPAAPTPPTTLVAPSAPTTPTAPQRTNYTRHTFFWMAVRLQIESFIPPWPGFEQYHSIALVVDEVVTFDGMMSENSLRLESRASPFPGSQRTPRGGEGNPVAPAGRYLLGFLSRQSSPDRNAVSYSALSSRRFRPTGAFPGSQRTPRGGRATQWRPQGATS